MANDTATYKGGPLDGETRKVDNRDLYYVWEKNTEDLQPGETEVTKIRLHKYKKIQETDDKTDLKYEGYELTDEVPVKSKS